MLNHEQRKLIIGLKERGHGIRFIARLLKVSKNTVKSILKQGHRDAVLYQRASKLTPHIDIIRDLHQQCNGNWVRVHEKLETDFRIEISYQALTAFCRKHEIGVTLKQSAGQYHFSPGQEMQHDTSPHKIMIDGVEKTFECASLILCYSRKLYAQVYPRWTRLECRHFLTEAIQEFGGAAKTCMIDNSSVIISRGTGPQAQPAAEMIELEKLFSFQFEAHRVGDANRSGRVERNFHYIENNFYPGRTFASLEDLNN